MLDGWKPFLIGAAAGAALLAAGPAEAGRMVGFETALPPGSIVISMNARRLYFVLDQSEAIAYPVAVAKPGKEWSGLAHVEAKYVDPAWSPPADVKRDHPELPNLIPGGSPHNPMGARALTLDRNEIAIHGTTRAMRASVGSHASYGCIRMYNEDVIDLYNRVAVGATVMMER